MDIVFTNCGRDIGNFSGSEVCPGSRVYRKLADSGFSRSNFRLNQFFYQANFKDNHPAFKNSHFRPFWFSNQYGDCLAG